MLPCITFLNLAEYAVPPRKVQRAIEEGVSGSRSARAELVSLNYGSGRAELPQEPKRSPRKSPPVKPPPAEPDLGSEAPDGAMSGSALTLMQTRAKEERQRLADSVRVRRDAQQQLLRAENRVKHLRRKEDRAEARVGMIEKKVTELVAMKAQSNDHALSQALWQVREDDRCRSKVAQLVDNVHATRVKCEAARRSLLDRHARQVRQTHADKEQWRQERVAEKWRTDQHRRVLKDAVHASRAGAQAEQAGLQSTRLELYARNAEAKVLENHAFVEKTAQFLQRLGVQELNASERLRDLEQQRASAYQRFADSGVPRAPLR